MAASQGTQPMPARGGPWQHSQDDMGRQTYFGLWQIRGQTGYWD